MDRPTRTANEAYYLTKCQVSSTISVMAKQRTKLSDQIRQAVATCGQTRYATAKATGISEATLCRFMSGERGLPMKTLDVLADYLELNITAPKRKGK